MPDAGLLSSVVDTRWRRRRGRVACVTLSSLPAGNPLVVALAPQGGLEPRDLAQQRLDGQVKYWQRVGAGLLALQDVRGQTQGQRGGEPDPFRVPLQVYLQVDRIRRKVFQMRFQLGDFLLQLGLQLRVRAHALGDQIPFQCHSSLQSRSEERRVGKECRSRWSPY